MSPRFERHQRSHLAIVLRIPDQWWIERYFQLLTHHINPFLQILFAGPMHQHAARMQNLHDISAQRN